jgi:hypothetical protein
VSQPITLVPGEGWSEVDAEILGAAAECWNEAFGTQLEVRRQSATWQAVDVRYNDLVCAYAAARTEPNLPVRVNVCSFYSWDKISSWTFFMMLAHELGHVLNIRAHGDDAGSIMASGADIAMSAYYGERDPFFSEEDRRMFREANPDFVRDPPCARVRSASGPHGSDGAWGLRCTCQSP